MPEPFTFAPRHNSDDALIFSGSFINMFLTNLIKTGRPILALGFALTLAACGNLTVEQDYPEKDDSATQESGSVLDYFRFGTDDEATQSAAPTSAAATPAGIGVNAVLWQASLDTLSFLPLASADPVGGTIITDWYNDPGTPNERLKVNVVISGMELRADALRVSIFRERQSGNRTISLAASSRAARQMENIILTRARDLAAAAR